MLLLGLSAWFNRIILFASFLWCLVDMANKKKGAPKDSLLVVDLLFPGLTNPQGRLILPVCPHAFDDVTTHPMDVLVTTITYEDLVCNAQLYS